MTSTKFQSRNSTQLINIKAGRPALRLIVRDGAPPMALESQVKVDNLNADLLDGLDASAFSTATHDHDADYLGIASQAADSALPGGLNPSAFALSAHAHAGYAAASHAHAWADITSGVPAGLADGDDDTLGGLACSPGQVAKRNSGDTAWECGDDDDTIRSDADTLVAVLAADGSGFGFDADLLDGSDSDDFASSAQRCPYGWTAAGFDDDGGTQCSGSVTLDESGGDEPSMVLDTSGYPVIACGAGDNLRLARCHDPYCISFTLNTIDSNPLTHRYKSLALDASGYPVVSYYDDTNHELKLAHCVDATCAATASIEVVDTDGDVGAYNSMLLDASGYPVIAYTDYKNFNLKVAHCDDATCASTSIETAATGQFTGEWTSIDLDASGYPVIAFHHDQISSKLRLAHCSDAECNGTVTVSNVDTSGASGQHASMKLLDEVGCLRISRDRLLRELERRPEGGSLRQRRLLFGLDRNGRLRGPCGPFRLAGAGCQRQSDGGLSRPHG